MSLPKYSVRIIPEGEYDLWDDAVEKSARGTLFHQTTWLRAFGTPFALVGCYRDNGTLVGGVPLPYRKVGGLTLVRPPYLTPYLGPLVFISQGKYHGLLTVEKGISLSVIQHLTGWCHFARIPLAPGHHDTQPFQRTGFRIDVEHTYVVTLDDLERVWMELDQDRRRKIRRGSGANLACERSDKLEVFLDLLAASLDAHGRALPHNQVRGIRNWYRALCAANRAGLFFVRNPAGRICGGALLVWDHRRAYYLLSGMNRQEADHSTMAWLIWECIRFCKEELGLSEFDFDGSEVPSVEAFFRGFGGRLTPRFSVMWGRPLVWPIRRVWLLASAWRERGRAAGHV